MNDKARKTLVFISQEIWRYVVFAACFASIAFLLIFTSVIFFIFTRYSVTNIEQLLGFNAEQLIAAAVIILSITQAIYIIYLMRRLIIFFRHL